MSPLERLARAIVPPRRADWVAALFAESEALPIASRRWWRASAFLWAVRLRLAESEAAQAASLGSVIVTIDWIWGSLVPALLLSFAAAAWLVRKSGRAMAIAVSAGALPLAHAVANWVPALWPSYQYHELGPSDWLVLGLFAATGVCMVRIAEELGGLVSDRS